MARRIIRAVKCFFGLHCEVKVWFEPAELTEQREGGNIAIPRHTCKRCGWTWLGRFS